MDDDLKRKYAPRLNKRYGHLPDFEESCRWAETLDWKNNDAHFTALARRVMETTDDELREKNGMRVDQVASWQELLRAMRDASSWFTPKHQSVIGIFIHLRVYVGAYIGDKLSAKKGAARKLPKYEKAA